MKQKVIKLLILIPIKNYKKMNFYEKNLKLIYIFNFSF